MVAGSVAWATGFGLRAILTHQVDDAENDRATGTRTLVTVIGERPVRRLMRLVLFPLDLVGIALLTATVALWAPWLVALAVVVVAGFHIARLAGVLERPLGVTSVRNGWFLYWTQIWPAFLVSIALVGQDPWNVVLVGVVLALFWPRLRSGLGAIRHAARHELTRTRTRTAPS
jgi:4-hydroxybenzoate polyprenyltransferase